MMWSVKFQFEKINNSKIYQSFQIENGLEIHLWDSWQWQLRKSLKSIQDFEKHFTLFESEKSAFNQSRQLFNIRTTPYYASLVGDHEQDPIRKILMPHALELKDFSESQLDPLGERKKSNNPVPRVVHRYSDRALFLVTDICSVYCRYCTRKHFTGADQAFINEIEYQQALNYFRSKTGLREIILSGGDPLTLSDSILDRVLTDLRQIDHIEIIRIGSRVPIVAPMRVTSELVQILRKHKPVYMMTHFNHPREVTFEAANALELFVDHGVPVFNQMVLLNGVNNHPAIVQALSRRLLFLRVKPYYMFQCDPSQGTDYLRTSIDDSLAIQKELWGHLSGLAMPNFSVDIPNGGGKTSYAPVFETEKSMRSRKFEGWDGVQAEYFNPTEVQIQKPIDVEKYLHEWDQLKNSKN